MEASKNKERYPEHIVSVQGYSCIGKTTLVRGVCRVFSEVLGCFPGQVLRSKYPVITFMQDEKPEAPARFNDFVQNLIQDAIKHCQIYKIPYLLIDGAPRSETQVDMLLEIVKPEDFSVFWLNTTGDNYVKNLLTRIESPDDFAFIYRRLQSEQCSLMRLRNYLTARGIIQDDGWAHDLMKKIEFIEVHTTYLNFKPLALLRALGFSGGLCGNLSK